MHKFYRIVRTALQAMRRNLLRSALTTLGIVIGVSAVMAMTEIGQGSSSAVQKTIVSMGANLLNTVMPARSTAAYRLARLVAVPFLLPRLFPFLAARN
jgi:ABC-type antimicrobial peptide transport system permease subunit